MKYKFQAIMWAKGAKIGVQTGDIKMDFKEKLPKKHNISKYCWVTENSSMVQLLNLWDNQGRQKRGFNYLGHL